MSDEFFDDLEKEINGTPENIEPVAFEQWEERGFIGAHTKKRKFPTCYHKGKTLDEECRMVICDQCGAYLDPFDVLYRMVCDSEAKQRHLKRLNDDIEEKAKPGCKGLLYHT